MELYCGQPKLWIGWSQPLLVMGWYFKREDGLRERRRQHASIAVPECSPGHAHLCGFMPLSHYTGWTVSHSPESSLHCLWTKSQISILSICSFLVVFEVHISVTGEEFQCGSEEPSSWRRAHVQTLPSGTHPSVFAFDFWYVFLHTECMFAHCVSVEQSKSRNDMMKVTAGLSPLFRSFSFVYSAAFWLCTPKPF